MSDLDPTAVAGGSGVAGLVLTLLGLWVKAKLMPREGSQPHDDTHEEMDAIKERLTRIEGQLEAARADNKRNESGIEAMQVQLNTMNQASASAQVQLASTLGRIEGELRARRGGRPATT